MTRYHDHIYYYYVGRSIGGAALVPIAHTVHVLLAGAWLGGVVFTMFAAPALAGVLSGCRVVTEPAAAAWASDHLPVMAEFGLEA